METGKENKSRRSKRQVAAPPSHPPAPWKAVLGRGPKCRGPPPPTYCAASRASMLEPGWFAACSSRHPYLYLGPAPWGGAGVPARPAQSTALLENPLGEGQGRGLDCTTPRSRGTEGRPRGHLDLGIPTVGVGMGGRPLWGRWERSWIWGDPKKVEKPRVPEVSKRWGGAVVALDPGTRGAWGAHDPE